MSNRAQRRRRERDSGVKTIRPQSGVSAPGVGPMLSVFEEKGAVVIHIAYGEAWVNQIRMSVEDAENHVKELGEVVRGMRSGIVVSHGPSGLIVPGTREGWG